MEKRTIRGELVIVEDEYGRHLEFRGQDGSRWEFGVTTEYRHPSHRVGAEAATTTPRVPETRPSPDLTDRCHLCGGPSVQGKRMRCDDCGVLWKGAGG